MNRIQGLYRFPKVHPAMRKIILVATASVFSSVIFLSAGYFATNKCHRSSSLIFQQPDGKQNTIEPSSPLRASTQIYLKAPPEEVFDYVSNAASLPKWMPGLESVTYDHSDSVLTGMLGEGSQRTMMFGGQAETEVIVQFEPPNGISYQITAGVPVKNHIAIMTVTTGDDGSSILTWNQYFDLKRTSIYGWFMPYLVRRFLNDAQANLIDKFDGEVVATCRGWLL